MPAEPTAGAAVRPTRRRDWVPILVALDTLLVAAVLVLAVVFARPDGGGAASPSGSASAPSGVPGTATAGPGIGPTPGPARFRLPSGNIACDMSDESVTCTIASITFAPPAVEGCEGTVGHEVVLDQDGVEVPCVEGPPPGVAGDDVPVLFYGASSAVGPYTCESATNGVTCTGEAGTGFRLARAELVELP